MAGKSFMHSQNWVGRLSERLHGLVAEMIRKRFTGRTITIIRIDLQEEELEEFEAQFFGVTIRPEGWRARFFVTLQMQNNTTWEVYSSAGTALGTLRSFRTHRVEYPLITWNKAKKRWETKTRHPFKPLAAAR